CSYHYPKEREWIFESRGIRGAARLRAARHGRSPALREVVRIGSHRLRTMGSGRSVSVQAPVRGGRTGRPSAAREEAVMAPPMSASAFLSALKAEGLTVVEVGNWRTHNRNHKGPWGPVHGVMIHHTVTKGSARTVEICRKGYSGLPGPLCHGVITKDGRVHLVGYGRANHAGLGDDDVLRAVIAERDLPADN